MFLRRDKEGSTTILALKDQSLEDITYTKPTQLRKQRTLVVDIKTNSGMCLNYHFHKYPHLYVTELRLKMATSLWSCSLKTSEWGLRPRSSDFSSSFALMLGSYFFQSSFLGTKTVICRSCA